MLALTLIAAVWIASGALAYGLTVALFVHEYPESKNDPRGVAFMQIVFGPIGLLTVLCESGLRHGLMFRLPEWKRRRLNDACVVCQRGEP